MVDLNVQNFSDMNSILLLDVIYEILFTNYTFFRYRVKSLI